MSIRLADSITKLPEEVAGEVVVSGSHGGVYAASLAARARCRAVILNDAGIGRDRAGIGGLAYCQHLGMAAAAVDHASARIGDAADMVDRGRISHANTVAETVGVRPGQACAEAARLLLSAPGWSGEPEAIPEAREVLDLGGRRLVVLIDSASLARPEDTGRIVVTGSHGALLGGDPRNALKVDAFAAFFNDAGIGPGAVGITRLPALERRGIAAATVTARSARIGAARSTYEDGMIGHANPRALALGAEIGTPLRDLVERLAHA
jgi:hypothetical protein